MADFYKYTDEELAALLQEGSKAAFTAIYERYWHPLWVFSASSMHTEEDSKDLVQEVFSVIWEKHPSINIHTSLKAFLYKTTLHLIIKQVNKTRNAKAFYASLQQALEKPLTNTSSPTEHRLAEQELINHFEDIVATMPPKMKEAFTASRMEDLSYKEIAGQMGVSKESVKTHIKHALKILRSSLNTILSSFLA